MQTVTMTWRPMSEQPPDMERPGRQFIRIEGWAEHSGVMWHRTYCGIARSINHDHPKSMHGFYREDIERLMKEGDMIGFDEVTHWMPVVFPTVEGRREP